MSKAVNWKTSYVMKWIESMSREYGHPSFKELVEDWLYEEFKSRVVLHAWGGNDGVIRIEHDQLCWGVWMHVPKDPIQLYQTEMKLLGYIGGHNVFLNVVDRQYLNFQGDVRQEVRNAADPDLFQWFARTVRTENYEWAKKAGLIDNSTA
jgi:hypothetical protein